MKLFLLYTLARLLLFTVTWGLVWLVASFWLEWNSTTALWTALLAVVISALAALVLLRGLRERFVLQVQDRVGRVQRRYDESKRREDVDGE